MTSPADNAAGLIQFRPSYGYNIHFINKKYYFIRTSQLKTLAYPLQQILGTRLDTFFAKKDFEIIRKAIDKVLKTNLLEWVTYSLKEFDYFALIDRVEINIVAMHEVFNNPKKRVDLKRMLWVASGNYQRGLYKKEVG